MKAILQYGQFTTMIELPEYMPTIQVMKPLSELSFMPLTGAALDVAEVNGVRRLVFHIEKQLSDEYWLYTFVEER